MLRLVTPELLIIDDLGLRPPPVETGAPRVFHLRHHKPISLVTPACSTPARVDRPAWSVTSRARMELLLERNAGLGAAHEDDRHARVHALVLVGVVMPAVVGVAQGDDQQILDLAGV